MFFLFSGKENRGEYLRRVKIGAEKMLRAIYFKVWEQWLKMPYHQCEKKRNVKQEDEKEKKSKEGVFVVNIIVMGDDR